MPTICLVILNLLLSASLAFCQETSENLPSVPLSVLRPKVESGLYRPFPIRMIPEILSAASRSVSVEPEELPAVRTTTVNAALQSPRRLTGSLVLDLYPRKVSGSEQRLMIGRTNLLNLTLQNRQGSVRTGADAGGRLLVLDMDDSSVLIGTFAAEGLVAGNVTTFRLQLPPSTASKMVFDAPPNVRVTSPGNLVLGPVPEGAASRWTILAGDVSRMIVVCRRQDPPPANSPVSPSTITASHQVTADMLNSRWTIGFGMMPSASFTLHASLPGNVRLTDIHADETRPVEWETRDHNGRQRILIRLRDTAPGRTMTILGSSPLPQTESWEVPMLALEQWHGAEDSVRGPVLTPVSQMTVLVPPSVEVDDWILKGIQERDVIALPDRSREYHFVRFQSEASAVLRTFSSEPRLSESVATMVQPAGRFSIVRCVSRIQCEGAEVAELQWPIAVGWQPVSVRSLSGHAVYFETTQAAADAPFKLEVHLPTALQPGSSEVIEIQFQQSEEPSANRIAPPLTASEQIFRNQSLVVFPTVHSATSDLRKQWGAGRRQMNAAEAIEFLTSLGVTLPSQDFAAFDTADEALAEIPGAIESPSGEVVQIHTIQLADGSVSESFQMTLPREIMSETPFVLRTPVESAPDIQWSLDGTAITAKQLDQQPGWRRWELNIPSSDSTLPSTLQGEARRIYQKAFGEFTATVAVPEVFRPFRREVVLNSPSGVRMNAFVNGIQLTGNSSNPQQQILELPADSEPVMVRIIEQGSRMSAETRQVRCFHLVKRSADSIRHEILAHVTLVRDPDVRELSVRTQSSIPPAVLVNGTPVESVVSEGTIRIPLPEGGRQLAIALYWEEVRPVLKSGGNIELRNLEFHGLPSTQTVHTVQVSPEFRAQLPDRHARPNSGQTGLLDADFLSVDTTGQGNSSFGISNTANSIRPFVLRWKLAVEQRWYSFALANPDVTIPTILQVIAADFWKRIFVSSAIFVGIVFILFRRPILRHRTAVAASVSAVLLAGLLIGPGITSALIHGSFWGAVFILSGLMLSAAGLRHKFSALFMSPVQKLQPDPVWENPR